MSALPTTIPDEALAAPGTSEADAIRKDYNVAMQGLRAYVSMGLRLIDVKERLPHGQYLKWCEQFLPELAKTHLHRAKYIAENLLEMAEIKCPPRGTFENLPEEITIFIDGASGYRALLGSIQEYREDQAEQAAKAKCYKDFFYDDAGLRDEWEPRVLSGELTWCQAIRGIAGQDSTKGQKRSEIDYSGLVQSSFATICNSFSRWESLKPDAREKFLQSARREASAWPQEVRAALLAAWQSPTRNH